MFKSIKIKNLRAITELEIDNLGQVNLLVGQNNCGKTTVLEALFLLIGATNPHLPVSVNTFRGLDLDSFTDELWPTFFHNMDIDNPINISGETTENKETQRLEIHISKKTEHTVISKTNKVGFSTDDSNTNFVPVGLELKYSNSLKPNKKHLSSVLHKEQKMTMVGMQKGPTKGIFLSSKPLIDLRGIFGSLQRKKQEDQVVNLLKEIDPAITSLVLNEIGLVEADIGLTNRIPVNLMGDGIVKFLYSAIAMLDTQNGTVLIDEIENGLHHSAQKALWKAILTWAEKLNVQVFATTHSYECVNAFAKCAKGKLFQTGARLFRIDRKEDTFTTTDFEPDEIERFMEKKWEVR